VLQKLYLRYTDTGADAEALLKAIDTQPQEVGGPVCVCVCV
jgi:hypothetical protein